MREKGGFLSVDPGFYSSLYTDLQGMPEVDLVRHYQTFGEKEGRIAASYATRQGLFTALTPNDSILEIGPFTNPLIQGPRVKYFDVLDKKALIERALKHDRSIEGALDIDFVSPVGDLSIIKNEKFNIVISSHCIEHQTDLIKHLNQVSDLLAPGGYYLLIIPDKRYCFDHYLPESTLADVVQANFEKRTTHSLASVMEHNLLTTHNDSVRHWKGDHHQAGLTDEPGAIKRVIQEYKDANGAYIDVHAWQFTPRSFLKLLEQLHTVDLVSLAPHHVFGTPHNALEFCAILRNA
jgi:SAM-dependent methyltransferase